MSFFTENSEWEQQTQGQKIASIMYDWELYNVFYRTGIIEYRFLYSELRAQNRAKLHKISESHLREFPETRILAISDPGIAFEVLLHSTPAELATVSYELDRFKTNYTVNTLRDLIKEYRYKIEHLGNPQGASEPAFPQIFNNRPNRSGSSNFY